MSIFGSSSKSKVKQKFNTTIINQSDVDILNESVNNLIANTIINQASMCSASVYQLQNVDLSGMNISGDLNIDSISQEQSTTITFDCVQVSQFQNEMASNIVNEYLNAIKQSFTADAMTQILSNADAVSEQQFGGIGSSSSNSKVKIDYNFENITQTSQNLQNIVKNSITNNLDLNDIQNCIASIKSNQQIVLANTKVGGNVTIGAISQKQASSLITSCIQKRNNSNEMTTQILNQLGIEVETQSETKTQTESVAKAKSKSKNKGIFEGVGSMFSGIIGSLSNPYSLVSLIVVAIVILIIGWFYLFGSSSQSNLSNSTNLTDAINMYNLNDNVLKGLTAIDAKYK